MQVAASSKFKRKRAVQIVLLVPQAVHLKIWRAWLPNELRRSPHPEFATRVIVNVVVRRINTAVRISKATLQKVLRIEIEIESGERFIFRAEIFQDEDTNEFFCDMQKIETFRVQPTFPQNDGEPDSAMVADYRMHVFDDVMSGKQITGSSYLEIKNALKTEITAMFDVS